MADSKWLWIAPVAAIGVLTAVVVNEVRKPRAKPVPYEYPLSEPPVDIDEPPIDSDQPPVVPEPPIDSDEPPPFDADSDLIYRLPPPKDPIGPTPFLKTVAENALGEDDFGPALVMQAYTDASFESEQFASVHVRNMPQLADVEGGLPIVKPPTTLPKTGTEFQLLWLTRAVASYPQSVIDSYDPALREPPNWWTIPSLETYHPSVRPDRACALLVTLKPPGEPQPIPGGNGAMMQVPPDYVLVPQRILEPNRIAPWNRPGLPFEFVQDEYGKILLRITLPSSLNGLTVWMQLLVEDRRVPAGCVSTPMIEMHIGDS